METVAWLDPADPDKGFAAFVATLTQLIAGGRRSAYVLALRYYELLRDAAGVATPPPEPAEPEFPTSAVTASLIWTGPRYARSLEARGKTDNVREVVGRAVGRAAMRHTLNAGRTTVFGSVVVDPAALGWARITDADPCDFCKMLAGRGLVYKTERSAGGLNRWHDGCACAVVPLFRD